jgi:hypothetical protein
MFNEFLVRPTGCDQFASIAILSAESPFKITCVLFILTNLSKKFNYLKADLKCRLYSCQTSMELLSHSEQLFCRPVLRILLFTLIPISFPFQRGNVTLTVLFIHLYLISLVRKSNRTQSEGILN